MLTGEAPQLTLRAEDGPYGANNVCFGSKAGVSPLMRLSSFGQERLRSQPLHIPTPDGWKGLVARHGIGHFHVPIVERVTPGASASWAIQHQRANSRWPTRF